MRRVLLALCLLSLPFAAAAAQKTSPAQTRDSDHDGVPDPMDRCPGTPAGFPVDANGCPRMPGDSAASRTPAASAAPVVVAANVPAPVPVPDAERESRVGIGVALRDGMGLLTLPIRFRGGMLLEPELGFEHQTATITDAFNPPEHISLTAIRLGIGFSAQLAQRGPVHIVAGPRVGVQWLRSKDDAVSASANTSSDFYGEVFVGGDYELGPRITIGGEAALEYTKATTDQGAGFTVEQTDVSLGARLAMRWYFR